MAYQNYNNIMNNLGYGNAVNDGGYISGINAGDFTYQNENVRANDFREDNVFLDNLLDQFDGEKRKEIIENLINERLSLKTKMKYEIENIKDHLRSMKNLGAYQMNPIMPFRDLAKLYSMFNHKAVEEEINAWKDISFLRIKLFDEGLTGGKYEKQTI